MPNPEQPSEEQQPFDPDATDEFEPLKPEDIEKTENPFHILERAQGEIDATKKKYQNNLCRPCLRKRHYGQLKNHNPKKVGGGDYLACEYCGEKECTSV